MSTLLDLWHNQSFRIACGGIIIFSFALSCAFMAGFYMAGIIGGSQAQASLVAMQPTLIAIQTSVAAYAATYTPRPTYTLLPTHTPQTANALTATASPVVADSPTYTPLPTHTPQTANASMATASPAVADLPTYTPTPASTSISEEMRKQIFYDLMGLLNQGAQAEVYSVIAERYISL